MTKNGSERARKALKQVEVAAVAARKTVRDAMRNARYENRREEQLALAREVQRLKREENLSNHTIAQELDISESSVRIFLGMKIPGRSDG